MGHYQLFDPSSTNSELCLVSDTLKKPKTQLPRTWGRAICRPVCTSHTELCLLLWHPEPSGSDDSLFEKPQEQLKESRNPVQPRVQGSADLHWVWRGQKLQEPCANSRATVIFHRTNTVSLVWSEMRVLVSLMQLRNVWKVL